MIFVSRRGEWPNLMAGSPARASSDQRVSQVPPLSGGQRRRGRTRECRWLFFGAVGGVGGQAVGANLWALGIRAEEEEEERAEVGGQYGRRARKGAQHVGGGGDASSGGAVCSHFFSSPPTA